MERPYFRNGRHTAALREDNANSGCRYELFTDEPARAYVKHKYAERTDIIQLFDNMQEPVLRADYIKNLTLQRRASPGRDWKPADYRDRTKLFVGIEYDARHEGIRGDFDLTVQLCQWTLASRPGNSALRHVVDRVTQALQDYSVDNPTMVVDQEKGGEIMHLIRPRIFTKAIIEAKGKQIVREIVDEDIMNLTGPKLIGDVLVMPINAFGTGQLHSGSGPRGNADQLISHHFVGFQTWKPSHEKADADWVRKTNQ
ncbi:hypothetical protein LTR56_003794 [Elasticomyces elasticus]|nr:hypothetical protein LTR22_013147 [Elasticomyces elasticus]KAK3654936.1 hypothetical protein LTR56_003794 [Elasticomyces elasticus]KAK4928734.1 hypothetical protein LTR49_004543 [Elasticomyces elasticus]KAK5766639.1 hypothetical protein LTS12_003258 [Elasticomyces elasticus]